MAKSTEYPDLTFVEPNAYGRGRDGKDVRYIVIHYTAGAERNTSAEDGAAYDRRRTDGTSTHYFVDSNSVVQCVLTRNRANAARHKGNRLGIQYELCGTVQTRTQWLDAASMATLKNAARQVARDCRKYGIPARRLSVAETRRAWTQFPSGPKGIVGHVDCTNAYPEDGGDHTDPGSAFPWDIFISMVRAELAPQEQESEDGMADITQERFNELFGAAMHKEKIGKTGQTFAQALDQVDQALNAARDAAAKSQAASDQLAAFNGTLTTVSEQLAKLVPPASE
jgi:N-acetyl-anhydromuramyl-L-alanine amidase AmpD